MKKNTVSKKIAISMILVLFISFAIIQSIISKEFKDTTLNLSEENLKTDQKPGYWIFKILEFTRKKIQLRKELEFPEEISQENREKIISLLATYDLKIPVAAQYKFEEKIYKYLKNKVFPLNNMESFEQYLSLEVKNDIQ